MSSKKKKKGGGVVFTILMVICAAVVAFSAYKLISINLNYTKAQNEYEDLRRFTVPNNTSASDEEQTEEEETAEISEEDEEDTTSASSKSSKKKKTKTEYKAPITVDHESLEAINPDYIGWLYIEAVDISYPIMKGPDDNYYLHRTFDGNYLYAGSLFVNSTADSGFNDPHTIIYGHNMKDSSMFGTLNMLTSYGLYTDSDVFWVLTKNGDYCYKMFSIHTCLDTSDTYSFFAGPSVEVTNYISRMMGLSTVAFPELKYDENSKVVTLSTCVSSAGSDRYVVQGIKVN